MGFSFPADAAFLCDKVSWHLPSSGCIHIAYEMPSRICYEKRWEDEEEEVKSYWRPKGNNRYWTVKEEGLDGRLWRTRIGGDCGLVVRRARERPKAQCPPLNVILSQKYPFPVPANIQFKITCNLCLRLLSRGPDSHSSMFMCDNWTAGKVNSFLITERNYEGWKNFPINWQWWTQANFEVG